MSEQQGLSLHDAAREAGVSFSKDWTPQSKGIKANKKKIQEHLDNTLMLVTALAPHI